MEDEGLYGMETATSRDDGPLTTYKHGAEYRVVVWAFMGSKSK